MFKSILSVLQALLFVVSSVSVSDSNFRKWVDSAAVKLTSKADFSFDSISADDVKVSDEEAKLCRDWYENNILTDKSPAYDFTVGGKVFSKNINDWNIAVGAESEEGAVHKNGKTTNITLEHKKSDIAVVVEATIYEKYATCEWTVYIKNNGDSDSPVVKNIYGINTMLPTGDGEMYFSKGSDSDRDDFELYRSFINKLPMRFAATGGRNGSFMPYFNINGSRYGVVAGIGWTGQWDTVITGVSGQVSIKAKQEKFSAYLLPGEEVRSPRISLSFYKDGNGVKGFNTLRNWEIDCLCNENIEPLNGYVIANEFSKLTTDDFIAMLDNINPVTLENTDYFWMDAGWYEYNEGWHDGVGNWTADSSRFPDGLKPLGDKIASMGKRFLLWYEPERVREGTILYNEGMKHDSWIIKINDDLLWNLGDPDAAAYLSDYISSSLKENGVTMYRQDFNFSPLEYWQKADKALYGGRKGICENHYVTNLYKYLDTLCENVDGLIIDNCASGGRRLDIEMTSRSIPLWRSDYNCGSADGSVREDVLEATQAMTYGLSCWIPYSGTNRYFHSEYASRTTILTNQSVYEPDVNEYAKYDKCSEYMTLNYYPLTYGSTDLKRFCAMQFGDGSEGTALIYKREQVSSDSYTLKLNGLEPDSVYEIVDIDNINPTITATGADIMTNGVTVSVKDAPKAVILMYSVVK